MNQFPENSVEPRADGGLFRGTRHEASRTAQAQAFALRRKSVVPSGPFRQALPGHEGENMRIQPRSAAPSGVKLCRTIAPSRVLAIKPLSRMTIPGVRDLSRAPGIGGGQPRAFGSNTPPASPVAASPSAPVESTTP